MPRVAVVIANSVASLATQKSLRSAKVSRTAGQVKAVLSKLPNQFAFETSVEVDRDPDRIETVARLAAKRCASHDSLLLVYYFGHARREREDLSFVHPGPERDKKTYLSFDGLLHTILGGKPNRVLFLLDCCYAGASRKQIELLPETYRKKCCLMACTSASTRAYWKDQNDNPIGYFTLSLIDGLSGPGGSVSAMDDSITADSLFKFVSRETKRLTKGEQEPYILGGLSDLISRYSYKPTIIRGISDDVSDKSSYCKLIAIIRTMGKRRYEDLPSFYRLVLGRYRDAFLTNFIDEDHRIDQRPAHWSVLRRYIGFLRAIQVVDDEDLMLTPRGMDLLQNMESTYNAKLLSLLTRYLEKQKMTIEELRGIMQRVMERRWLPTRENVLTDLFLERGHEFNERHLALLLDLLGCIGVIGTLRKKQQVYFPWNEHRRRFPRLPTQD